MICSRVLPVGIKVISTVIPKFITVEAFFVEMSFLFNALVVVFLIRHCFISNNSGSLLADVFGFFQL